MENLSIISYKLHEKDRENNKFLQKIFTNLHGEENLKALEKIFSNPCRRGNFDNILSIICCNLPNKGKKITNFYKQTLSNIFIEEGNIIKFRNKCY